MNNKVHQARRLYMVYPPSLCNLAISQLPEEYTVKKPVCDKIVLPSSKNNVAYPWILHFCMILCDILLEADELSQILIHSSVE